MVTGGAVGQVAAMGERHAHDAVARLQQRQEHRLVRLSAGMRLDVGVCRAEQLLQPLDGHFLDLVDELAAAIVALTRIAFGIFVGQHRALRRQHVGGDDVFRGDQLDLGLLPVEFLGDGVGYRGV
jgi:hypothetical protein